MASAAAIPPFGKMYLTVIWLETILYGVNCVLFGTCIYILASRRKNAHWMLYLSSTFLFSMATAHVVISFLQLLHAFTDPAVISAPHGPDIDLSNAKNPLGITNGELYCVIVTCQDLLLIWRLYIVWDRNWRLCILPLLVEVGILVCASMSAEMVIQSNAILSKAFESWTLGGWSLTIILNGSLTLAIAFRLWMMGRRVSSSRNPYKATIIAVMESGALYTTGFLIVLSLDGAHYSGAITGVYALAQLATTTPLLIIFRLALGSHGNGSEKATVESHNVISMPPFVARGGLGSTMVSESRSDENWDTLPMHSLSQSDKHFQLPEFQW